MPKNGSDICKETLKDVDNIPNEFPDVPEFKFSVDTSHFNFNLNPINQSIFPADKSVQLDFNPNPINQSVFLAGISIQPDLNPNSINQGPTDVPNDNLPLRESTNVLEKGPKKNCARTYVKKLERNAEIYPVLSLYKDSCIKRCIGRRPGNTCSP